MPPWSSALCNLYWMLRAVRHHDESARRRFYRRIEAEKKRLIVSGVDQEELRLFCRYMANPGNRNAEQRFRFHLAQMRFEI